MDKEFVERMKEALESLKKDFIDKLAAENSDFREIVEDMDPKDLVDIAADDMGRKTLEALGAHKIKNLRLIDAALSRIENDRYGRCMRCNKKIPTERLEAIPYALMCIDCQSQDERQNR